MKRQSIMDTYKEIASVKNPVVGRRIYFEFVSKYRRVIVVADGSGFEIETSYKGLELASWTKRYGDLAIAMAWAERISANNEILLGCLTLREPKGKRII